MLSAEGIDQDDETIAAALGRNGDWSLETAANTSHAMSKASCENRFWQRKPFCIIASMSMIMSIVALVLCLVHKDRVEAQAQSISPMVRSRAKVDLPNRSRSGAEGDRQTTWPWRNWCNQKLISSSNNSGCIVDVRADLPALRNDAEYEVSYATHRINAGGDLATMINLGHSVLLLQEKVKDMEAGLNMVLEYFAINFGPHAVFPVVEKAGNLSWDDEAVVGWLPIDTYNKLYSDWIMTAKVISIGNVTGHVLSKWFDDIPHYSRKHPGYQLWTARDGVDAATAHTYKYSSTCHDFTEWGMKKLYSLGASFYHSEPLCRNYFILQTNATPSIAADLAPVLEFYKTLWHMARFNSTNFFVAAQKMQKHFRSHQDGAYIHERRRSNDGQDVHDYYKVVLKPPYLSPKLFQRVPVPWYIVNGREHECSSLEQLFVV